MPGCRGLALGVSIALSACAGVGPDEGAPPVAPVAPRPVQPPPFTPSGRPGRFLETLDATTFQKGNVHTHSTESDGDSSPAAVYAWYRDHGYNFLGLSDHNRLTDPARYRGLERRGFVILPAEEVTMHVGKVPVHVNAICERARIDGGAHDSIGEALRWAIGRIHEEQGVALVNHPNFKWAFGAEALPAAKGAELLEIWSGHPQVHAGGDAAHPSEEAIWDAALTSGLDFGPAAVDDVHFLGAPRGDTRHPGPGRAWIEVFAASANEREICAALRTKRLVASNGPRLRRLHVEGDAFEVTPDAPGNVVEFIGRGGALLDRQTPAGAEPSAYRLRGGEAYVRARVTDPKGAKAWTNAYRVVEVR